MSLPDLQVESSAEEIRIIHSGWQECGQKMEGVA